MRSKLKLLLQGAGDQTLLSFVDQAVTSELHKALLELHYSQELSLLYLLQDDVDRAQYYIENCIQAFMQVRQVHRCETCHSCDVLLRSADLWRKSHSSSFPLTACHALWVHLSWCLLDLLFYLFIYLFS